MGEREHVMQQHGVFRCPPWCIQPEDEHQYEQHFSDWEELELSEGQTARLRVRKSWWEGSQDEEPYNVEIEFQTDGQADPNPFLTGPDVEALIDAFGTLMEWGQDWDAGDWEEAYEGAGRDEAGESEDEDEDVEQGVLA